MHILFKRVSYQFICTTLHVADREIPWKGSYNPPALLLPTVLVNIIVVEVYFYRRLRIQYPEFILVVKIVVSEARYKTLHSTSHRNLSEWVGVVDTASSYEQEGRGFETRLLFYFFLHTFSCQCLDIAQKFKTTSRHKVYTLHAA